MHRGDRRGPRVPQPAYPCAGAREMISQTFGVDISARWFDVAAAHAQQVRRSPNTPAGITACLDWLATFAMPMRVGMEATGSYHLPLATALRAAGHVVL